MKSWESPCRCHFIKSHRLNSKYNQCLNFNKKIGHNTCVFLKDFSRLGLKSLNDKSSFLLLTEEIPSLLSVPLFFFYQTSQKNFTALILLHGFFVQKLSHSERREEERCKWDSHVVSHMIAVSHRLAHCDCVCVCLGRGWNKRAESAEPVAATRGQRAGGVSLPRGDIISCVLSAGRRCRHKGRGRAKDRGGGGRRRRGRVGFKAGVRGLPPPHPRQRSRRRRVGRTIRSMRSNLVHSHNLLFLCLIEKLHQIFSSKSEKMWQIFFFPKIFIEAPDEAKYTNQKVSRTTDRLYFFILVKVLINKRGMFCQFQNFSSQRRDTDVVFSGPDGTTEHQNESFTGEGFVHKSHVGFLKLTLKSASD